MILIGETPPRAASVAWQSAVDPVAEAIAEGLRADIRPYELRGVLEPGLVVGYVYTPFVRIARWAHQAAGRGESTAPEKVPVETAQPVIHVLLRDSLRSRGLADGPTPRIGAIRRPQSASPPGSSAYFIPVPGPLTEGITISAEAASAVLGEFPVSDILAVAVFPASYVTEPVLEFCVFEDYDPGTGPSYEVTAGFLRGPIR
jgi:hypothetical protein